MQKGMAQRGNSSTLFGDGSVVIVQMNVTAYVVK
jgi:hypothetical protein